jgi:peptidyl-prolyl cis-trans isomerase C
MRCQLTVGLVAGLWMTGAALAQDAPAPEYDANTVLATVNGVDITLGHALVMRERLPQQYQQLPDDVLLSGIVDQLVDQTLLAEEGTKGSTEDPLEVKLHLENERRGTLAARVVKERVGAPVDQAEIEAAYQKQVEAFTPQTEYQAAHILVPTEEEAKKIAAELEGGADFAELATLHSTDPGSGASGGSLGWFGAGQMVPEFEAAVKELEPGAVSAPVKTQFGWHIVKLEDTRETTPATLEEARPEIENVIRQQRLEAEIEGLREQAQIDRPESPMPPEAIRQNDLLSN